MKIQLDKLVADLIEKDEIQLAVRLIIKSNDPDKDFVSRHLVRTLEQKGRLEESVFVAQQLSSGSYLVEVLTTDEPKDGTTCSVAC